MNPSSATEAAEYPAWAVNELAAEERPAVFDRLMSLGISKEFVARVCGVEPQSVTRWRKKGYPTRKGHRAMERYDRLGGLVQHMERDLALSDEDIEKFLAGEETSYDWQIDDSVETTRYRSTPLVVTALGTLSARYALDVDVNTIEVRLKERFAENYASISPQENSLTNPQAVT